MMRWINSVPRSAFVFRAILLLLGVGWLSFSEALERLDAVIYDQLSALHRFSPDRAIAIVAIDDESLRTLGRWPWSRIVHAQLIDRLRQIDNRALAIDLLFTEPQDNDPNADRQLADAIAAHGAVVLPVAPVGSSTTQHINLIESLPVFRAHAALGHVDIELDSDGIARRVYLQAGIEKPDWPVLGQALVTYWHGAGKSGHDSGKAGIHVSGRWVRAQETLIPYLGPPGSFQQIPYVKALFDDNALAMLKDKIVIVGMTAAGMGMKFATPASPINRQPMSGAEWHANVLSMLLHGRSIYPVSGDTAGLISVAWMLALLLVTGVLRGNATLPVLLMVLSGGVALVWFTLHFLHFWLPPAAALLGTVAIYPLLNWRRINEFMQSLFVAKVRSNTALESVGDGVVTTDANDRIVYMNKGAEHILGVSLNQVQGVLLSSVLNLSRMHDGTHAELKDVELPVSTLHADTIQCFLRSAGGEEYTVRIARHLLRDESDALMGSVVVIADMTDTVELTKQVVYQANYDVLTKLPNRVSLMSQLETLIPVAQQRGETIAIFFVALDNFRKINDALGRRAGDDLLKMVAGRLAQMVSSGCIVTRWGGDEFVLLLRGATKETVIPQVTNTVLELMRQKFDLHHQDVFITASIGIGFYPEHGKDGETVLERAGMAMHRVKKEGGDSFSFYSTESSVAWTKDRLELEKELRIALHEGQLQVFYQPIVNVRQRRIVRLEALMRWPHPVRGFLPPGDFLPLAESAGLMERLGTEVLRLACDTARKLQDGGSIQIAVNVHPRQLLYGGFIPILRQIVTETRLPAPALIIEITENAIIADMVRASEVLHQIKAMGISIALDDFGTGYSSLTLLRELPIDILKIDKSFISNVDQNPNDLTIAQAIIGLGTNLGLSVIAEGVESERQMQLLLDHDCYLQQGYYFSRPVSYETVSHLLRHGDLTGSVSIERLCDAGNRC